MASSLALQAVIERKAPNLPRFVVIPAVHLATWHLAGTTVIEGSLNEVPLGRRSLKPWDSDRWFLELPGPLCAKAGVDVGDRVRLTIQRAPEELPLELAELLRSDAQAKAQWTALTPAQQRMLREHVMEARHSTTRARRAARGLGLA